MSETTESQLLSLDRKVSVIRSQLDLILSFIVDKFGDEQNFPIDIINSFVLGQSVQVDKNIVSCKIEEQFNDEESENDESNFEDVDPLAINEKLTVEVEESCCTSGGNDNEIESFRTSRRTSYDEQSQSQLTTSTKEQINCGPTSYIGEDNVTDDDHQILYNYNIKPCIVKLLKLSAEPPNSKSDKRTRTAPARDHKDDKITKRRSRNHSCKICLKPFCSQANLKLHLRVHTGERPFPCRFCEKRFRMAHHLRRHEKYLHKCIVAIDDQIESESINQHQQQHEDQNLTYYVDSDSNPSDNHVQNHNSESLVQIPNFSCGSYSRNEEIYVNPVSDKVPQANEYILILDPKKKECQVSLMEEDTEFHQNMDPAPQFIIY